MTTVGLCLFAMAGCGEVDQPLDPEIGKSEAPLYVKTSAIWDSGDIPVCWENPTANDNAERQWVQTAIEQTWEDAAAIDFEGWGECGARAAGIRIRIEDLTQSPHTHGLGDQLASRGSGMSLNFTFNNWGTSCQGNPRRGCIESIAAHEFGHALGFAHEHNRSDTPTTCTEAAQGSNGNETYGSWDLDSIMNYCNPVWNNGGSLSDTDINGARHYYPGNVHMHAMDSDGTIGAYLDLFEWTNGWTTAEFYNVGSRRFLFILKERSGLVHIHPVDNAGRLGGRIARYDWSGGWTSAQFFTSGSSTYLFLLKQSSGVVHIHRMNANGTVGARVQTKDWSGGWDTVKIASIGSYNYLLLLKSGTGDIHIHRMNANGTVGTKVYDRKWSRGWTTAELFTSGSGTYLFLLKKSGGVVHIQRMNANGTVGSRVQTSDWSSGWTSAGFYQTSGYTYMILLKSGNGQVHFHRMNANGTVGTRIDTRSWRPGWTTVEPYSVAGAPQLFLLQETYRK